MNFKLVVDIFSTLMLVHVSSMKSAYRDTQDIICNRIEYATIWCYLHRGKGKSYGELKFNCLNGFFRGPIYSNPLIIWNENIVYLQNERPGTQAPFPDFFLYLSPLWSKGEEDGKRNAKLADRTRLSQQAHLAY